MIDIRSFPKQFPSLHKSISLLFLIYKLYCREKTKKAKTRPFFAVTAMTTYADGSGAPAFIISINDYALNFLPEK